MTEQIKIYYTYESVAKAAGVSVSAVKMYFKRKRWDFADVELVACYVIMCKLGKLEI